MSYNIPKNVIARGLVEILGQLEKITEKDKSSPYANPPRYLEDGAPLSDVRDKLAPNADKPTTAAGEKGELDLPSVMSQIDPNGLSSVLPAMFSQFALAATAMRGSSQSSRKKIIEDSLSGALAILVNKYTYDQVIEVFNEALKNKAIKLIEVEYRDIVKGALANLFKTVVQFGPNNVPVYTYSTVTTIGPVPSPLVTIVPDLYIQQYYIQSEDPYPGFVKWVSQDETEFVFTKRKIGDIYYKTPQEEIYSISEQELSEKLDPYIRDRNLTARILNDLLKEQDTNVENNTSEKTMGKNSSKNLANFLLQLLGYVATIINSQKSTQLPVSVLNQSSISSSLDAYSKNIAMVKGIIKPKMKKAIQGRSAASDLPDTKELQNNSTESASAKEANLLQEIREV
jgi:hypothetical protein